MQAAQILLRLVKYDENKTYCGLSGNINGPSSSPEFHVTWGETSAKKLYNFYDIANYYIDRIKGW